MILEQLIKNHRLINRMKTVFTVLLGLSPMAHQPLGEFLTGRTLPEHGMIQI